jgi:hypothetical protein
MLPRGTSGHARGWTLDGDEDLWGLLETERERTAAVDRGRRRRLRDQAAEESTLAGTLRDAAEAGTAIALRTTAGRSHHGTVSGVGVDFCALRQASGRWVYVAWEAIASVRVEAGFRSGDAGTRLAAEDRSLVEVLAYLAPDRPRVTVGIGNTNEPVVGDLRAVGEDIATIRLDGARRDVVFVRLGAVTEVSVDVR